MFGKKKIEKRTYDKEEWKPVIRASICNGEQIAGFKNKYTGKFKDIMLIREEEDLRSFLAMYNIQQDELEKEW